MSANSLLASGVHALCYLAYRRNDAVSARDVARSLATNPVVARKLLKALEARGLVRIRRGRNGGVALDREPAEISLRDVYEAVEEGRLFALRERSSQRCPVAKAMKDALPPVFADAQRATALALGHVRLDSILHHIP